MIGQALWLFLGTKIYIPMHNPSFIQRRRGTFFLKFFSRFPILSRRVSWNMYVPAITVGMHTCIGQSFHYMHREIEPMTEWVRSRGRRNRDKVFERQKLKIYFINLDVFSIASAWSKTWTQVFKRNWVFHHEPWCFLDCNRTINDQRLGLSL